MIPKGIGTESYKVEYFLTKAFFNAHPSANLVC